MQTIIGLREDKRLGWSTITTSNWVISGSGAYWRRLRQWMKKWSLELQEASGLEMRMKRMSWKKRKTSKLEIILEKETKVTKIPARGRRD